MGEAIRMREKGVQFKQVQPGQQINVDVKDATPISCLCGCKLFTPAIMCYTVSALLSPTGQELLAQQSVLVCMECKEPLK